ncbi:hypothetical protein LtaPh_2609400 [Leishmania tarentolae]|uniref:Uncharacterized protein n=1 Tax=Leishmania tarentolae TaxID=5689 RepID=A0A640KIZ4_LEITA|nr:hypothetical protein LtaPh_2609400 [Leishmania tarentolae]
MTSTFTALDELEREMNKYLDNTQTTGSGDIEPVLFHSARVQLDIQDLSQRVQQKSIALEDRSRSL